MTMSPADRTLLLFVLVVIACGACGCSGFSRGPTVVPTILPTAQPSTTTAPPTIAPIKSLQTGTQITWAHQGGYGQLVIRNEVKGQDIVAILAPEDDPGTAVLAVYVKSGDEYTVDGVTDGRYVLYDMVGTNWDDLNKKFLHTSEYARFDSTLNYYTTDTESKKYTVTITGAGSGDALSRRIGQDDMPNIGP
jgi:hypothetical protein